MIKDKDAAGTEGVKKIQDMFNAEIRNDVSSPGTDGDKLNLFSLSIQSRGVEVMALLGCLSCH